LPKISLETIGIVLYQIVVENQGRLEDG